LFKVKINGDTVNGCNENAFISDILIEAGARFSMPCGGKGTCGKCKVKVSGAVSEMSGEERGKLTEREIGEGVRLACFAKAVGDINIFAEKA
jgi:Na+-transporting NADH:ubiquinone oxidoreductase subunit NqrF